MRRDYEPGEAPFGPIAVCALALAGFWGVIVAVVVVAVSL
jgi:hypothetical protein